MTLARLFRRIHMWLGLAVGLQVVLWCASGAAMALIDRDSIAGAPAAEAASPWPELAPVGGAVEGLTLRRLAGRPVYEVRDGGAVRLLDAATGTALPIDAAVAEAVARRAFAIDAPVRSVARLEEPNLEARAHQGPMWRIDFADGASSSAYVSAETGRPLVVRTDLWRAWDVAWMLHNMDYAERTSFNHPLIVLVTFVTLWLMLTGLYLLFPAFRRRR
ncbi:MAG: PepSY domain-containing protein [Allosphingosinicella sp.]|uniref:PepSY domain-containing protein n=1 Tax=Allosphingosinicella sp. TaxID=2823234 RepID=UPI0039278AC7